MPTGLGSRHSLRRELDPRLPVRHGGGIGFDHQRAVRVRIGRRETALAQAATAPPDPPPASRISARSPQPATTGSGVSTEMALASLTSAAASLEGSIRAAVICALGTVTKRYCTLPTQPPLGALPAESKLAEQAAAGSPRLICRGCRG